MPEQRGRTAAPPAVTGPAAPWPVPVQARGLDPRIGLLVLMAASVTVMSPGGLRFVPAALVLATALALWDRAWSRAAALPLAAGLLWVCGWLLPLWWGGPLIAMVSIACVYLIRFVITVGIGLHLIATVSPTRLSAALRACRTPRPLAVTLAVMLRFFPVVVAEAAAVFDAMRLRGLAGPLGLARHPLRAIERFVVPMIAASLRAAEDLSCSAILRGLGSHHAPTAMIPPRPGRADLICVASVALLALASLLLPGPLA